MKLRDGIRTAYETIRNAYADTVALTVVNTPACGALELMAGMDAEVSGDVRLAVAVTNPLFGTARQIYNRFKGVKPENDFDKRKKIDKKFGWGVAGGELLVKGIVYPLFKLHGGKQVDMSDLRTTILVSAYTGLAMPFLGRVIDTARDGLGSEERGRSLFPETMPQEKKAKVVNAYALLSTLGVGAYYYLSR